MLYLFAACDVAHNAHHANGKTQSVPLCDLAAAFKPTHPCGSAHAKLDVQALVLQFEDAHDLLVDGVAVFGVQLALDFVRWPNLAIAFHERKVVHHFAKTARGVNGPRGHVPFPHGKPGRIQRQHQAVFGFA